MQVIEKKLGDIHPYENNPRKNDKAVEYVANSLKEFGWRQPIVIDKDGVIVAGHTRYNAAKKLKMKVVPCVVADDLTEEQIKAYRLADNKVAEFSEWDIDLLSLELDGIDMDLEQFGFDLDLGEEPANKYDDFEKGSLAEKYIVPPFSVLHVAGGDWSKRKKEWIKYIHSGDGREEGLTGGFINVESASGIAADAKGTSIFDPVLAETLIKWFCPEHGNIIDCFAGGSVRGLVSAFTGHEYVGVDLSRKQIDANEQNYLEVEMMTDFYGEQLRHPTWICGDSSEIDVLVDGKYDFMLTCPPYADLEVYSDDERDISNMEYPDFLNVYRTIIKKTTEKLKDNAFAAIIIREVRDKKGNYYNFVGDTIKAFLDAGLNYYNEIILETPIGTAALRADHTFSKYRKICKIHQNVLIFVKGDAKKIELSEYAYEMSDEGNEV